MGFVFIFAHLNTHTHTHTCTPHACTNKHTLCSCLTSPLYHATPGWDDGPTTESLGIIGRIFKDQMPFCDGPTVAKAMTLTSENHQQECRTLDTSLKCNPVPVYTKRLFSLSLVVQAEQLVKCVCLDNIFWIDDFWLTYLSHWFIFTLVGQVQRLRWEAKV